MLQMFDEVHKFERKVHGLQCVYCKRFLSQIVAMSEERKEAAEKKCEELQKQIGAVKKVGETKRKVKDIAASQQYDLFLHTVKEGEY